MWHEARKQEKKIRGLMVDYKRRAERRRDYYEKIKTDPTQFIQIHGRPYKIHLDPAVALAADSPSTMMSWQGDRDIMIDRFDVRAHLDFIPEVKHQEVELTEEESQEERFQNYERYRILVQNDFLGIPEDKFFAQLALEEQYGPITKNETSVEGKKKSQLNAAIGFRYDDEAGSSSTKTTEGGSKEEEHEVEEDVDSDMDFDLSVDVSKVDTANAIELNNCAHAYGMKSNDYFSYLTRDMEEAENLRLAKEEEEEKALFSGRKSRRERRAIREKSMMGRRMSPLAYAAVSPTYGISKGNEIITSLSKSKSRSPSPVNSGKIMYITSFGETEEEPAAQSTGGGSKDRTSRDARASRHKPYSVKSRSRTRSPHSRRASKRSRTKSKSPKKVKSPEKRISPKKDSSRSPPVKRYYGRNIQDSSSELELSDSDTSTNSKPPVPTPTSKLLTKPVAVSLKITPQERLKKKMQKLLNKQFKADKKAEQEKIQKLEQERHERAEEMKELSLKLKMKERQRRYNSDEDWDDDDDRKSSKSEDNMRSRSVSSSRSKSYRNRSRSPARRRSPLLTSPDYPRHAGRYHQSREYDTRDQDRQSRDYPTRDQDRMQHHSSREYDSRDQDRTKQEMDSNRCYQSRGRDRVYQSRDQERGFMGRTQDSRYEQREQERSYAGRPQDSRFEPRDQDRYYPDRIQDSRYEPRDQNKSYQPRDTERSHGPAPRHNRFTNNIRRHNQEEYESERGRDFESSCDFRNGGGLQSNSRSRDENNHDSRRSYNNINYNHNNREDRPCYRGNGSDRSRSNNDRSRRKEEYSNSRYESHRSHSPNSSRLVDY